MKIRRPPKHNAWSSRSAAAWVTNEGQGLDHAALARWRSRSLSSGIARSRSCWSPAALPSKALHTFGDCAAGDQHDLLLAMPELSDLLRPARECGVVQPLAFIGDQAAADLDDPGRCASAATDFMR